MSTTTAVSPPAPAQDPRLAEQAAPVRQDARWALAGAVLTSAYFAQVVWGWRWEWLALLQDIELYKQLSGLALVVLIAAQWQLSAARMLRRAGPGAALLAMHRQRGALAPILLYLHSISLGHAYVRVMSLVFLALLALGLLQRPLARLGRDWIGSAWLVAHVALATSLVLLVGYHAFNAFYYE
jgi:hypothetical protein